MSITYKPYRYSLDIKWNGGGDPIEIPSVNISNIILVNNYMKYKMPIIYMTANIPLSLLDMIIKQRNEATIIFDLQKFSINDSMGISKGIKKDYIKHEFVYFLNNDINYRKDILSNPNTETPPDKDDMYVKTVFGLLLQDNLNDDKMTFNNIYSNCSMTDIILSATSHMKLLMEPLDDNKIFESLTIPPTSSISGLLKELNGKKSLYGTPYRYYIDYDRTYLISSKGNNIQANDEVIKTVIINIGNPVDTQTKVQGVHIDTSLYIIELDASFTKYYLDNKTDNLYNNIISVDAEGNMSETGIDTFKLKNSSTKTMIVRSDNVDRVSNEKAKIEISKVCLKIIKDDIDSSVFTMNKEYNINNYKDNKSYDGKYILVSKQEVLNRESDHYKNRTILVFNKIIS